MLCSAQAAKAAFNADGKLIVNGAEVQWSVVTGDDEKAYYERLAQSKQAADKRAKGKSWQNKGQKGRGAQERGGWCESRGIAKNESVAKKRKAADKALQGGKVPRAEGTHTKFDDDSDEGERDAPAEGAL